MITKIDTKSMFIEWLNTIIKAQNVFLKVWLTKNWNVESLSKTNFMF